MNETDKLGYKELVAWTKVAQLDERQALTHWITTTNFESFKKELTEGYDSDEIFLRYAGNGRSYMPPMPKSTSVAAHKTIEGFLRALLTRGLGVDYNNY